MRKTNRSSSASNPRRRVQLGRPTTNPSLERLRRRFTAFRRNNPRSTQIPDPLRKAVVAALHEGMTRSAVQKACGVSWAQIDRWQASCGPPPPRSERPARSARVLSVVDDTPPRGADPPEDQLELRLGAWSICVRPVGSWLKGSR
jgi:hypothetical protein